MDTETSFDRLQLMVGDEGLKRLREATVMVIGLGGVGSSCAEALARGGIGHLVVIDRDVVTPSNINRQAIAFTSTLGRPKADVMREMALDINPNLDIYALQAFLPKDGLAEMLDELPHPTYVVDAIDTLSQKLAIAQWAQAHAYPLISSMGGANKLDPCRLRFAHIEDTVNCPLCRVMRKECRKRGIHDLQVLFSDEKPQRMAPITDEEWEHTGSVLGTMSYLPPIMGQMLASFVIRHIAALN